jgi:hypothetical protein
MATRGQIAVLGMVLAAPAAALTPAQPCDPAVESGMTVSGSIPLGGYGAMTGVVVEYYEHKVVNPDEEAVLPEAPLAALDRFIGQRVVHCTSGRMVAFLSEASVAETNAALSATEFLRLDVQYDRGVSFGELRKATSVLFNSPMVLTDNEETCGCAAFFPEDRPEGMTPYDSRS